MNHVKNNHTKELNNENQKKPRTASGILNQKGITTEQVLHAQEDKY